MSHIETSTDRAEALWSELGQRIRAFIDARIERPQDAEDVLQNVFLKIHQEADSVRDQEKVQAWVYRVARNAVIDHYRSRGRTPPMTELSAQDDPGVEPEPNDVHEEVLGWLEPMIQELPPKYRLALQLADVEGLPQREVAERLGLSLSGAKSRVQRARTQLGTILQACCKVELGSDGRVEEYRRNLD